MSPFPLPIFYPFPDALPSPPEHKPTKMIILVICPEQGLYLSSLLAKMNDANANAMDNNPTLKLTINIFDLSPLKSQKGES